MQLKSLRTFRKGLLNFFAWTFIFPLSMMYASLSYAIDPPTNIQLNDGRLSWDAVEGADQYHLYYFNQPVPSNSNLGNYVRLTGGTRWSLDSSNDPFGYYTVVAVRTDEFSNPVEFSKITDSTVVPYLDPNDNSTPTNRLISIIIESRQCDNIVSGTVCAAVCTYPSIATGGACRADVGVTLHQRALENEYQCLAQQDTAFVQADAYCLNATSQ